VTDAYPHVEQVNVLRNNPTKRSKEKIVRILFVKFMSDFVPMKRRKDTAWTMTCTQ